MKQVLQAGSASGIFLPNDVVHRCVLWLTATHINTNCLCSAVFYWLWVPIVQQGLDKYRAYWNNHTISKSKKKKNPSGSCPKNMFLNPSSVSALARDCSIRVNPETVAELREAYGGQEARDKAYRFVSEEFQFNADAVYQNLGAPELSLLNGWKVFTQMVTKIDELRVSGVDLGL